MFEALYFFERFQLYSKVPTVHFLKFLGRKKFLENFLANVQRKRLEL